MLLGVEAALRGLIIEKGRKGNITGNHLLEDGGEAARGEVSDMAENETDEVASPLRGRSSQTSETQSLLPRPLPPLATRSQRHGYLVLLRFPRFLTPLTVIFALSSTVCGFDAVLAPYISSTFNLGPVNAAALFLALAIPMLFAPLTGWLTDRYGPKIIASSGLAIWTPALAALSLVGPGSTKPMLKLGGLFFVVGIAQALTSIPLRVDAAAVVGDIEKEQPGTFGTRGAYAMAFGFVNGMEAAGGMTGPLVAGLLRIRSA